MALLAATATAAIFLIKQDARGSSPAAVGGTDAKTDEPDKDCKWVAGKPATRCSAKGETPGEGTGKILASYACKSVCGGPCQDGEWHKTGEDRKGCAWVSSFPEARCKVWGEVPGEEGRVRAATACPDSCA